MRHTLIALLFLSLFTGCIGDDFEEDFVEPELRLVNVPDTILVGSEYAFEFKYFNNVGLEESIQPVWTSSNPDIVSISIDGLATANAIGSATVSAQYQNGDIDLQEDVTVNVGDVTVVVSEERSGKIMTTTFYELEGDFTINPNEDGIRIDIAENYVASSALPGLYLYLSNNKNSISGAFEVSEVEVFSGAHSYQVDNINISEFKYLLYFCKPFNVKVGDGEILE